LNSLLRGSLLRRSPARLSRLQRGARPDHVSRARVGRPHLRSPAGALSLSAIERGRLGPLVVLFTFSLQLVNNLSTLLQNCNIQTAS
jgi:hypothetical protein